MSDYEIFMVEEEFEGERLDFYIAERVDSLSRSSVKLLIQDKKILVNGEARKASYNVKEGENVSIEIPEPIKVDIEPRNIPLDIVYEDSDLAIVIKPKGLVVHPGHGNWDNTMVNALLYHIKDLSSINGEFRPGIVHRLDKDTSGIMVVAKNDNAHLNLAKQIKNHTINREYIALVHGIIKENLGTIDAPIERSKIDRKKMAVGSGGKAAISNYTVMERFQNHTLVKVKLFTGRTHQIRVHFAYIRFPVVGDPVYGPAKKGLGLESQALHAWLIGFDHPATGQYIEFTSPIPSYFENTLNDLRNIR